MNAFDLISVVITTYNRSDALLTVLRALMNQTDRNFETIVADDGSRTEHQRQVLDSQEAKSLGLTYIWHPDVGFTASRVRNQGVMASRGKYVVFLDGDCVPEIDFIVQHKRLAQPRTFVNGSRVLLSQKLTQLVLKEKVFVSGQSNWYWLRNWIQGGASKLTGLLRLPDGFMRIQRKFQWKGIRSCNMGVWRENFEQINGFDESFVGWGHEDADFVLRLHNSGVARKNGFCATEVFHLWHEEAARDKESQNAKTVRERSKTTITQPTVGLIQDRTSDDVVVTTLR
jgi:GT2 family glycosyltransferase